MRFNTAKRRGKSARVALSWQSAVAAIASALWHYRVARARGMVRFDIPKGPEASARCALGSQSDTHDRCHGALPGQSASTALFSREAPWHEGAFHRSPSVSRNGVLRAATFFRTPLEWARAEYRMPSLHSRQPERSFQ